MSYVAHGFGIYNGVTGYVAFGFGLTPLKIPARICLSESTASLVITEVGHDNIAILDAIGDTVEIAFLRDTITLSDALVPLVVQELVDYMDAVVTYDSIESMVSVVPITVTESSDTVILLVSSDAITALQSAGVIQVIEEVISCDD